jgi:hypothetical protein
MRGVASYLLAGILVVLALDMFAPPAGLGLSVNAWSVVPPGETLQYVDRSNKGDRLNTAVTTVDKQPLRKPSKMMDGCDPVFSPLSASASANFPGRCAV